jgi:hypothetical protein
MSNINNLFASMNKGNNKFYSYLATKMVGFSQPKYMVTNHMLLNLKSNIKAKILWPILLSNVCRKEMKGRKNL